MHSTKLGSIVYGQKTDLNLSGLVLDSGSKSNSSTDKSSVGSYSTGIKINRPNVFPFSSLGVPGPTPLQLHSPSPQTPKVYAREANEIRERRAIFNQAGESCEISNEMSARRGRFSCVYELVDHYPQMHPRVPNDEIVVKILKYEHIGKATKYIGFSIEQYEFLRKFFEKEESPPIVKIYNTNNAVKAGYTLLEKVRPLNKAPWDKNSSIDQLGVEGRNALDSIEKLMKTKLFLDLKWNNLGVKKDGTVALLDYDNIPLILKMGDSYSGRLSGENPYIAKYIDDLEKKMKS